MEKRIEDRTRRLYADCVSCLMDKQSKNYPPDAPEDKKVEYMLRIYGMMGQGDATTNTLEIMHQIYDLQDELFPGWRPDYTEEKVRFNDIMLSQEDWMWRRICRSADPLRAAVQYAMMGNYIDFTSVENVTEEELKQLLIAAEDAPVDEGMLKKLDSALAEAKSVVLVTDNCGEIVTDKLLLRVARKRTGGEITAIVKGAPVVNDATIEDARQVGMTEEFRVVGNGCDYAGFHPNLIDQASFEAVRDADVVLSKGLANLETLCGFGFNVFYIFLCKCALFSRRFSVPRFTGVLIDEASLTAMDWFLRV